MNLEEVDVNGSLREAEEAVAGDTRLAFLKKAGLGAGAFVGGGAVLSALAPTAMAATKSNAGAPPANPFGSGDIGILNYALTLEYLERDFYAQAREHGVANGDRLLMKYLNTTAADEAAHVRFLKKALGSKAIASPVFDFGKAVRDKTTFAKTAYALENTGVHAYSGQAGNIQTPAYLLAALSIVTIEARHAGAIGLYLGNEGIDVTGAFDVGYTAQKVLGIVESTKFVKKL